jgi:hypothetical protein
MSERDSSMKSALCGMALLGWLVGSGCAHHGPRQTQLGTRSGALWVPHIPQSDPVGASWRYSGQGKCGHAALAMVARAFHVRDDLSDADLVDEMARLAIVAGNVHALPWHRPGPPNGHYVTVSAALPDGRFVVHDPGSDGPRIATQADLEAFMRTKGNKPGGAWAFTRTR